jgi:hypothetical protein
MAGEIASLLLSRMTVPVLFYLFNKHVYDVSSRTVIGAVTSDEVIYSTLLVRSQKEKNL